MAKGHYSDLEIEIYKIAKQQQISMTRLCEGIVEFHEQDGGKARKFVQAIKGLNRKTRVVDLIASNQYTDVRGCDIRGDKALYLTDDNYYNKIIGATEKIEKQLTLF